MSDLYGRHYCKDFECKEGDLMGYCKLLKGKTICDGLDDYCAIDNPAVEKQPEKGESNGLV